jgi:hypothetical protein
MACFNSLSDWQKRHVVEEGYLPVGRKHPEGGTCQNGAELEVETQFDKFPGPRFYCVECAVEYLLSLRQARAN